MLTLVADCPHCTMALQLVAFSSQDSAPDEDCECRQ